MFTVFIFRFTYSKGKHEGVGFSHVKQIVLKFNSLKLYFKILLILLV